jgi:hypothetical protein
LQIKHPQLFLVWVELYYEFASGTAGRLGTSHFRRWRDAKVTKDVINSVALTNSTIDGII